MILPLGETSSRRMMEGQHAWDKDNEQNSGTERLHRQSKKNAARPGRSTYDEFVTGARIQSGDESLEDEDGGEERQQDDDEEQNDRNAGRHPDFAHPPGEPFEILCPALLDTERSACAIAHGDNPLLYAPPFDKADGPQD